MTFENAYIHILVARLNIISHDMENTNKNIDEYINKTELLSDLRYSSQWNNMPCPDWVYNKIENTKGLDIENQLDWLWGGYRPTKD